MWQSISAGVSQRPPRERVSRFGESLAVLRALLDEGTCTFTGEHHRIAGADTEVWLTRKGAIRADVGDRGVIPGSMGTSSYIVSGKGADESYRSCSHGAGRRMSRTAARKRLDTDGLVSAMEGTAWNRNAKALIDEDPRAYVERVNKAG